MMNKKNFAMVQCTTHIGVRTLTVYVYLNNAGTLSAIMDGRNCIVMRSRKGFVCVKERGGHGFPRVCDERYNVIVKELQEQLKIENKSSEYRADTRRLFVTPVLNSEVPHMTNVFKLTLKEKAANSEYFTKSGDKISEIIVLSNEAGLCVGPVLNKGRAELDIDIELSECPEEILKLEDITDYDFAREAMSGVDASWAMLCLDAYDADTNIDTSPKIDFATAI